MKGIVYESAARYGLPNVKCAVLRGGGKGMPSAIDVLQSCEGRVVAIVTTTAGAQAFWSFDTSSPANLNVTVFETMDAAKAARHILTHTSREWNEHTGVSLRVIDRNLIIDYQRGFYRSL